ncbi:MAG: energy transducer TonB [Burkholderiaceae bacterium]|nr:energy transducer TonB [Burkholderiaceae bacterium]
MTSSTTPAFQSKSGLRFVTLLTLVTLAHALVIILLLAHFGWLNGVGVETNDNAGQSGFVIPVTLETDGDQENKLEEKVETELESTPEPTSIPTPAQETTQEPVKETPQEPAQEKAPTEPETSPSAAPPTETQTQATTDVEKEIPLAAEPEAQPAATQPVMPPETPQTTPPAPAPLTAPAPVSPLTTSPQTTTPVSPKPATSQTMRGGSSENSSPVALTDTANDSLPTTPAQVDPNYLHRPNPIYPAVSKRLREAGTVLLRVSLDATGEVRDINIQTTSAYQRLDQAAMEAVRQWRFVPASRGQQPVASTVLVPIEFKHQ